MSSLWEQTCSSYYIFVIKKSTMWLLTMIRNRRFKRLQLVQNKQVYICIWNQIKFTILWFTFKYSDMEEIVSKTHCRLKRDWIDHLPLILLIWQFIYRETSIKLTTNICLLAGLIRDLNRTDSGSDEVDVKDNKGN